MLSFLRETVSNALKHAEPDHIEVIIDISSNRLSVSIINDGKVTNPETWQLGFGLSHLRERFVRNDGELRYELRCSVGETDKLIVTVAVPIH